MQFSTNDLRMIVAKSSALHERLTDRFHLPRCLRDQDTAEERVAAWWKLVAKDDRSLFMRRLAADDLDLAKVIRAFDGVSCAPHAPLPAWTQTLSQAIERASRWTHKTLTAERDEQPFEDVFLPFAAISRERLLKAFPHLAAWLDADGQAWMESALLQHLCSLGARLLAHDFDQFVTKLGTGPGTGKARHAISGRQVYETYIRQMYSGGLAKLFRQYPVFARLIAVQTDQWVSRMAEFFERLSTDYDELVQTYGEGRPLGRVVAMNPFVGDLHNHGRSVILLTFESGKRLVYKPRAVDLEHAFFGLLKWMNQNGSPLPWKLLEVLPKPDYGWVEFVDPKACTSRDQLCRYYRRAGMLIALMQVLQGTDCHYENLIADGEHPLLIDLETLMYPHSITHREAHTCEADIDALDQIQSSVLGTGLLPGFERLANGDVVDVGGLSAGYHEQAQVEVLQWTNINTDRMSLQTVRTVTQPDKNMPRLDNEPVPPWDFEADLIRGANEMYGFLVEAREQLLAKRGPLSAFQRLPARFIFRNTKVYARLLDHALDPEMLCDGVDRFIQFDVLARGLLGTTTLSPFWALSRAEHEALARQDVPMFYTTTSSMDVRLDVAGAKHRWFASSGYDRAVKNLRDLDRTIIKSQIGFVRTALFARNSRLTGNFSRLERDASFGRLPARIESLSQNEFVRAAVRIGRRLQRHAIRGRDGSATWIAPGYISAGQRSVIRPLEYGLYDGGCGVALFLAALEKLAPEEGFGELARHAFQPILNQLAVPSARKKLGDRYDIGAGSGLGSMTYALAKGSQLLDCPRLLEAALQAAAEITEARVRSDTQLDVLGGSAGVILSLLPLYDQTHDATLMRTMAVAGNRLLNQRAANAQNDKAWRTIDDRMRSGFSHGAAGIVLAMSRLYQRTGQLELIKAVHQGLEFERKLFSHQHNNWAVNDRRFQGKDEDEYVTRWCYGASGIGLARLGSLPFIDDELIRSEVDSAVAATRVASWEGLDHLCCGNFGRIETLLEAGRRLGNQQLIDAARLQAQRLLARAAENRRFEVLEGLPAHELIPGFFVGASGIGYELLRLAEPNQIPSVLLWE